MNWFKRLFFKKVSKHVRYNLSTDIIEFDYLVNRKINDYEELIIRRQRDLSIIFKESIVEWEPCSDMLLNDKKKALLGVLDHYEKQRQILYELILPIGKNLN